ncbi:MAG: TonB-dependent receptor [Desulfovibrio sp.]|jgi:vitamin B12 transporter|nr:TonB-dependent receptor [Desulfovibrio sp.]
MKRFIATLTLVTAFFATAYTTLAQAAEAEETQAKPAATVLKKIVVTATAEPEEHRNVTANLQVIDAEEIRRSGAFNLSGLLRSRSSVMVREQPGNWTPITMRGFRTGKTINSTFGDTVQILIDGNRAGTGWIDNIPLAGIERVEILRGPAAVLYGSSSVGGIINIITKKGRGKPAGVIEAASGSNDFRSFSAGMSLGVDDDRFGFAVAGKQQGANDYNVGGAGLHRYKNTAYQKAGGAFTASFRPVEHSEINAVAIYNNVYDTGSPGDIYVYTSPYDSVKNEYSYGSLSYTSPTDKKMRINLNIYANENKYKFISPPHTFDYSSTGQIYGAKAVLGFTLPKVEEDLSLGNLALGSEYVHSRSMLNKAIYEPDFQTDVWSFFGEYTVDIGPVTMRAGLRYDYYTMEADAESNGNLISQARSRNFDHLTWSLGGIWHITEWLGLRTSVGTAYVPPTSLELVGDYYLSGARTRGNDKLKAQRSLTWDTGLEFDNFGFSSSISYFHTEYKDRIISVPSSILQNTTTYINQGRQYIAGLEFSLRYDGSIDVMGAPFNISPYFNMEYLTERTNRGGGSRTTRIEDLPEYTGSTGVNFSWRIFALDVNMEFVGRRLEQDYTSTMNYSTYEFERKTFDAFHVFNARFTVEPVEKLFVYAGVNNMEDKRYGYKPEYPMPGRTFYGGVRFEF